MPLIYLFVFSSHHFLGLHLWHMEVPRGRGWISGLQLLTYATVTATPDPTASVTYTIAHGNLRYLPCWARPRIEPTSSCILVGFVTTEPQRELNFFFFLPFRAKPVAHGSSLARRSGWSYSNVGTEPHWHTSAMPGLSLICNLHPSSQQCQILKPLSKAREGARILVDTLVGLITAKPQQELPGITLISD